MINLPNSFLLARTKLKIRKVRLIISVIISSIMFSTLIFGSLIYQGAVTDTLARFKDQGLSGRAILKVENQEFSSELRFIEGIKKDSKNYKEIQKLLDQKVAKDKAIAKKIGLEFNEKDYRKELNPLSGPNEEGEYYVENQDNPIIVQLLKQESNQQSQEEQNKVLQKIANKQKKFYQGYQISALDENIFENQDNKYVFIPEKKPKNIKKQLLNKKIKQDREPAKAREYSILPKEIYKSFEINHNWSKENNTIPIMVSSNFMQQKLNLKKLSKKASKEEIIDRNRQIISKSKNYKFKQCYFNNAALALIEEAKAYQEAVKMDQKNKGNKDYIPQSRDFQKVYQVSDSCSLPSLIKDSRSKEQKILDEKQKMFDRETKDDFEEPQAFELEFEVVGILPVSNIDLLSSASPTELLISFITKNDIADTIIPEDLFDTLDNKKQILTKLNSIDQKEEGLIKNVDDFKFKKIALFEFKNSEQAKEFKDQYTCKITDNVFTANQKDMQELEEYYEKGIVPKKCLPNKIFMYSSYGNKLVEMDEIKSVIKKILKWIIIIITIIATIIMTGTIGKLIGDSRKETAVFRAIGFNRLDIFLVYLTYTNIVSLFVIVSSSVIAFIGALIVSNALNRQFTTDALYIFGSTDFDLATTMIGFNFQTLGVIALTIIGVGWLSLIIPILSSMKRNPINDMRNE